MPSNTYNDIKDYLVDEYHPELALAPDFVEKIKSETGTEGIVARCGDIYFKLKTDWYVQLHSNKDSVSNPKRLVLTVLDNNHDDLRALFFDDKETLTRIDDFEKHVTDKVHENSQRIINAYAANRGKERKFYAIDGRNELASENNLFGVYMALYEGVKNQSVYDMVIEMFKRKPDSLIPGKYL